ncbi:MAG: FecR domain-containing protein [Gemmatimonadales bacterium]|nr:FecR domain-containing protein [Gemmatimonadales bacterium]
MSGMDWELLDRYLARECTAEERKRVERWMEAAASNRQRVELLADAMVGAPATPRAEVWESIERQLDVPQKSFSLGARPTRSPVVKVAVLLLAVGGTALAGRAVLSPGREVVSPAPAMRVVTTPPGQRASLRLPDGTRVMLGVASTLRHPPAFAAGSREVELEGEAYFEVRHDPRRPFQVRAGDLVAEDLGTEFVVRAYRGEAAPQVVVREGEVALRAVAAPDSSRRVLLPGQLGRLAANGSPIVEPADTASYFAWTNGWLVLRDTPLRDALPQLGRWYDLDFRLADSSLGATPLSGRFKNELTDTGLDLLAASVGARQVRDGRVVTLYPTGLRR